MGSFAFLATRCAAARNRAGALPGNDNVVTGWYIE
jgi:hypothetical protein